MPALDLTPFQQDLIVAVVAAVLGGGGTYTLMRRSSRSVQLGQDRLHILDEVLPALERSLLLDAHPSIELQLLDVDVDRLVENCRRLEQVAARLTFWELRQVRQITLAIEGFRKTRSDIGDQKRGEIRRVNGAVHSLRQSMSARFHSLPYRGTSALSTKWHVWRSSTMS